MATVKNTLLYDISDVAHTAQLTATAASSTAQTALSAANQASSTAFQAQATADSAVTQAGQAFTLAQSASTQASQAFTEAQQAAAVAAQAETNAQQAISDASDANAAAAAVAANIARVYYKTLGTFSAVEFVAACARPKIIGPACPQAITLSINDVLGAGYEVDWTNVDDSQRYSGSAKIVNMRGSHIDWTLLDQSNQSITKKQLDGETMVLYYSPVDGWVSLVSQF